MLFTLIPRYIYRHLDKLLTISKKRFVSNYTDLLVTYFLLGTPITLILYYASSFGDSNTIKTIFQSQTAFVTFLTSLIILVSIRISIIMKKSYILAKIPKLKVLEKWTHIENRGKLKDEFQSYLFGIFLTAFLSAIMALIFKVIFLRSVTKIFWMGYNGYLDTFIGELLIYFCDCYPEFKET